MGYPSLAPNEIVIQHKGPGALSIPGPPTPVLHQQEEESSFGRTQPDKSPLGATVPLQIASCEDVIIVL